LDNLAEQTARTNPTAADTDGDGLPDGQEVLVRGTDPRNPDSDGDRLADGAEVAPYGSDPNDPDTDDGGVRDGVEVARDGTNPTDPADDRPAGRAMVMDGTNGEAVIFDRDTESVVGRIEDVWGSAVGDCAIQEDGLLGFATTFSHEIHAIDLGATPPARTPPPNPIPIDNPGEDLAFTPDGRFIVACDGSNVAPVVVVDVATRTQIAALDLGTDCTSVDVCADGSVLVTSVTAGVVRRLEIDAAGLLSDTGVRLVAERPVNVVCAPDARSGVVLSGAPAAAVTSFAMPGMERVDERVIPDWPVAAAFGVMGDMVYVRHASDDTGGIQAFGFDRHTGHLSAEPSFAFPVAPARRFFGIDTIAVDPTGTELYVTEKGALTVFDAATGRPVAGIMDPAIDTPTGVCLRHPDRDHDGMTDERERRLGSDPDDPDSDDDGLLDGFEMRHGLDPLSPLDGAADGDADGLDNAGEQAARTDPANPDTDGDGLRDGEEIATFTTDPRNGDSDDDGLTDGDEVHVHATDPRNPDSDGGGILDGNEATRDLTDPRDPADDLPAARAIFTDSSNSAIVAFDQETSAVLASLTPAAGSYAMDCVIPAGGREGYVASYFTHQISVVDLAATPPVLEVSTDPISISNNGKDLAASPDGRFLVACGGAGGISVVDRMARAEIVVSRLVESCDAVDVCPDGSVLVTSGARLHRLTIDSTGDLADTGDRMDIPAPPSHSWSNVHCAPDGDHAIALGSDSTARSFRLRGLEPVDTLGVAGWASSAVFLRTGGEAVMFVSLGHPFEGVAAYTFDLATGRFGGQPLFTRAIPGLGGTNTIETLALDRTGELLYVARGNGLYVFSTRDGSFQDAIHAARYGQGRGVCAAPAGDLDGDPLPDDEERRLGSDPRSDDTDGDGLRDGFEVRNGFDARAPGEPDDDPDADGLDNLGEQAAGTGPRNPDTDADGLSDGQEVLVHGSDPLDPDTDDDAIPDGADVCPRDIGNDPDGDGVCQGVDTCPGAFNPTQIDGDADGHGDACDICPRIANVEQREQVACFSMGAGDDTCLETTIDLVRTAVDGAIIMFDGGSAPPEAIDLTLLDSACATGDRFEFELNGVPLGGIDADPTLSCICGAPIQTLTIDDATLLSAAWRTGNVNVVTIRKLGFNSGLGWVRLTAWRGAYASVTCLYDEGGGDCDATDLCAGGYALEPFERTSSFFDPLVGVGTLVIDAPFAASVLPETIDLTGLAEGPYLLCVRDDGTVPPSVECGPIALQGETRLVLGGDGCGADPVAAITGAGGFECQSPDGAVVLFDGTVSGDPDGDIALFEWFEDFGSASERLLATGESVPVALPSGAHAITLRVTDSRGRIDTAEVVFTVRDTTPPAIGVSVSPATLWPPAHQIVPVTAAVAATDLCGGVSVVLVSVASSEPDDAPGGGDGQTTDDVDGVEPGAADLTFGLRAERAGDGPGRTYTVTYQARDAAGNTAMATASVTVPHDRHGRVDPIDLRVSTNPGGTVLDWTDAAGLEHYNVVRGEIHRVRELPASIDIGPLTCVENQSPDRSTLGREDADNPPPGEGFFYLIEYDDGVIRTFGSDTVQKPRLPGSGGGASGC